MLQPKRRGEILIVAVVLASLLLVSAVSAGSSDLVPPRLPCTYFGSVTINGAPAPVNTVITAQVDGVDLLGKTIVTTAGKYESLSVQNNFGTVENPRVTFYANGVQASQVRTFEKGAGIKVDLTFGTAPTAAIAPATPAPVISSTSKVIARITPRLVKTVIITPPAGPANWDLSANNENNNQVTIGNIHIVANCDYTLSIQGSTGGYLIGEAGPAMSFPTLKNPVLVWDGTKFSRIEKNGSTSLPIYSGHPGTVDVPLRLQQVLVTEDADKINPTIVFSYVVTMT
jgi:hypothetical protein